MHVLHSSLLCKGLLNAANLGPAVLYVGMIPGAVVYVLIAFCVSV